MNGSVRASTNLKILFVGDRSDFNPLQTLSTTSPGRFCIVCIGIYSSFLHCSSVGKSSIMYAAPVLYNPLPMHENAVLLPKTMLSLGLISMNRRWRQLHVDTNSD
jgi:hypothetical protein